MGHRAYSRQANGRFRRATLENTFGLSAPSCPDCGRLNPHSVGEPAPTSCHACGMPMNPPVRMPAPVFADLDDTELSALIVRLEAWDIRMADAAWERLLDRDFRDVASEFRRELTWALSEAENARDRLWGEFGTAG